MEKNNVEHVTPLQIAKILGVQDQYLEEKRKEMLNEIHVKGELKKTEEDFFNSDFVVFPI